MHTVFEIRFFGGSVGERRPREGSLVAVHDTREEAIAHAKRMNAILSPGEKKYYGLRYRVIQATLHEGPCDASCAGHFDN